MRGVPPGVVGDVGTLPDSCFHGGRRNSKTCMVGVMNHQHIQDKVGRGG